jgi:hypothetical protein
MSAQNPLAERARAVQLLPQGIPSPCVSVCRMNAASGLCEGCLRTLDEIAAWSSLADEGKRRVWALIEQRVNGALP